MTAVIGLAPAVVVGWLLVRVAAPAGRGWIGRVLEISLGAGVGAGVTSVLYLLLLWAGATGRAAILALEAVTIGLCGFLVLRRKDEQELAATPRFAWTWALRIAAVVAVAVFAQGVAESVAANPHGEWDAFSIWNLKAKFLAGGEGVWRDAVAPDAAGQLFGLSHPGYPLLVPGAVARAWTVEGGKTVDAPVAVSVLFTAGTAGLLAGAVAWSCGEAMGLLALLVLLASEGFASQAGSQYADIPLGFFILATLALVMRAASGGWDRRALLLAGLCAGLAAWTKNEGLPFLLAALGTAAWRGGARAAGAMAVGAAPAAFLLGGFKLALVKGSEAIFPATAGEAMAKAGDPSRWLEIGVAFGKSVWQIGTPWTHPVLLVAVLAVAAGAAGREELRRRAWLALPVVALLAADFGVYLVTTADLTWHLGTSNIRLLVQVWPALLLVAFLLIEPPSTRDREPPKLVGKPAGRTPGKPRKRARARADQPE